MGITYASLRLSHFGRDEIEALDAEAVVDTGANDMIVPALVAEQLKLGPLKREVVRALEQAACRARVVRPDQSGGRERLPPAGRPHRTPAAGAQGLARFGGPDRRPCARLLRRTCAGRRSAQAAVRV